DLERKRKVEEQRLARVREEQRKAEEARKAEEKRRREQAEARAREQREEELRLAMAEEERRMRAEDSGLLAQYVEVIRQRVQRNWIRPPEAQAGLECVVNVSQIPGGEVVDVRFGRCNGDDVVRRSIEAAVLRASPLPPPADPSLFERNLEITFRPEQ
ncbi:MAG: TonB C-terminal domain-containing protein, partial [Chromatiales bacterium]|nr:TonB C-terminal domain-containing protein [Chromatiales bacterium]